MPNKYRVIQKSTGLQVDILTESKKEAHEKDIHLRGKYIYEPIEAAPVPKDAVKKRKAKTVSEWH